MFNQDWILISFLLSLSLSLQEDLYYPHPLIQDMLWTCLHKFVEPILMRWPGTLLREKALQTVMEHIHYEDENTRYICIGPVNKVAIADPLAIFSCSIYDMFGEWVRY